MKKYTVTLRNRNNLKVTVGDDEAIIDAVENMGHLLPIACRYGGCITCAAKLIDGKVKQPNATALNKRQSQDGYILLCVTELQVLVRALRTTMDIVTTLFNIGANIEI